MSATYENVKVASSEDIAEGVRIALARLGLSYDELAAMAVEDEFPSEDARLVWFMISPDDGAVC